MSQPPAAPPRPALADEATRARRLAICDACPDQKLLPAVHVRVCGRCNCALAVKTKFTRALCPLGKW